MRLDRATRSSFAVVLLVLASVPLACSSARDAPPMPSTDDTPKIGVSREAVTLCEVRPDIFAVCLDGTGCCGNRCTDLTTSSNCGTCGNVCARSSACSAGHCCPIGRSWCGSLGTCVAAACDCPPDLDTWLARHPNVAAALKFQSSYTVGASVSGYEVSEVDKQPYASWPVIRKQALAASFNARYTAMCKGLPYQETLIDPPINVSSGVGVDTAAPHVVVTAGTAETMYIAQVAHSLAIEIGDFVPWSVTGYDSQSLAVIFDSAAMMGRIDSSPVTFAVGGWYSPYEATSREANRGRTVPAPPSKSFAFMKNGLLGATRHASIVNLMQWGHDNMNHFYGASSNLNHQQTWGYRGHPPVMLVIAGTTSTSPDKPADEAPFAHWTGGCHGTAGFVRDVLRTVNIPVQIPHVCGHSQIYFRSEGLYVDHADDLYSGYGTFPVVMENLLIDQATYTSWFGDNLHNEDWAEEMPAAHCMNVARRIIEVTPP